MFIVTIRDQSNTVVEAVVSHYKSVVDLVVMLELSNNIKDYKVSDSDGQLTDLKYRLGVGHTDKFVSGQFVWH